MLRSRQMTACAFAILMLAFSYGGAVPARADIKSPAPGTTSPTLKCVTVKEWVCTAKPGEGGKLSDCHWETSQQCTVVKNLGAVRK